MNRGRAVAFALVPLAVSPALAGEAGERAAQLSVAGTEFRLQLPDGRSLRSAELVGAVLDVAEDGVHRRLRIDAVEADSTDPSGEVLLHTFSVYDRPTGRWEPLCQPDLAGRRLGFPFATSPEQHRFALTCTAGAEAKCIRMGYRPWKTTPDGQPLTDHFRACIHMVRADYCGDDRPATRDGTIIDVYDRVGIQQPSGDPGFRFEAGWGPQGAVCVARTRVPALLSLTELNRRCVRAASVPATPCTEAQALADPRALVFNRSRPRVD